MRRWRMLPRSRHTRNRLDTRERRLARLAVEQLEGREVLAPLITAPTFIPPTFPYPQLPESAGITLTGNPGSGGTSFNVFTPVNSLVDATLSTAFGLVAVDPNLASSLGVSVSGVGTPSISLMGASSSVSNLLQNGLTFVPAPGYSGDAAIDLFVRDTTDSMTDSRSLTVQVLPVPSPVFVDWDAFSEIRLGAGPFAFPPGFLSVSPWPDLDGSETLNFVIRIDAGSSQANAGFVLRAAGNVLAPSSPGTWTFSATDPFAFQAILDSLTLIPPPGFSGRVTLSASGIQTDQASFPSDGSTANASFPLPTVTANLRFFAPAVIMAPPVLGPGGGVPFDLGGQYQVLDPSELPEDTHTLTITPATGALTQGPAPAPSGLVVEASGRGLVLSGELADINLYLSTHGSLTFSTNDPQFIGTVQLLFVLQNEPGVMGAGEGGEGFEGAAFVSDYPPPTVTVVMTLDIAPPPAPGTPAPTNPGAPLTPPGAPAPGTPGATPGAFPPPGAPGRPPGPPGAPPLPGTPGGANVFGPPAPPGPAGPVGPAGPGGAGGGANGNQVGNGDSQGQARNDGANRPAEDEREGERREGEREGGPRPVVFLGFTGAHRGPEGPAGNDGPRGAPVPPAHNQPFPRTDALPLYLGADGRHPLPPVLPLDQTRSVTGFSESAGDSLGLVDLIYRDAGGSEQQVLATLVGSNSRTPPAATATATAPASAPQAPEQNPLGTAGADATVAVEPAPADAPEANNYAFAAGAVLASLTGWMSRRYVAALFRSALRLIRPTHRQPTQGSA